MSSTNNKFTTLLIPAFIGLEGFEKYKTQLADFFNVNKNDNQMIKAMLQYKLKDVTKDDIVTYFYNADDFSEDDDYKLNLAKLPFTLYEDANFFFSIPNLKDEILEYAQENGIKYTEGLASLDPFILSLVNAWLVSELTKYHQNKQ
jgi:hypothetical protein